MAYYKTNAIYERLAAENAGEFVWASGNAWILLYGDATSHVKLVAFVAGSSATNVERARDAAEMLAERASLPFATIAFDDGVREIDHVELNGVVMTLDDLTNWFEQAGLPVRGDQTGKAINDASSSAYQDWQRRALGAIRVTDIDLIRQHNERDIVIYELKRSHYALDAWSPFRQDFSNFDLIVDLCERAHLQFRIAYNVRHKQPFFDDPSQVAIFTYTPGEGAKPLRRMTFEDFVKG